MADKELKVQDAKKEKAAKKPFSVKNFIVKIIIVILALLMVGSAYYIVILLTSDKSEEQASYGSYDGENILLEYNNVFYNTLMSDENFQNAYSTGDYNSLWTSYYQAYQSQVMYIALTKLAKKAGITAPQALVNKAIIESGVYNDENGSFSEDVYKSTDATVRSNTEGYFRTILPYQTVLNDIFTTVTSAQEKAFVSELAGEARNFSYFAVDYNSYPDEKAKEFAQSNTDIFKTADITTVAFTTVEECGNAYTALTSGADLSTIENASVNSMTAPVYEIQQVMTDPADIDMVLPLEAGTYSRPVVCSGTYVLFRVDSEFAVPDFTDKEVLSKVKSYMALNEPEEVKSYIEDAKESAATLVKEDFDKAAEVYGSGFVEIKLGTNNVGGSQFISGLEFSDPQGRLAAAATDETVSRELFTSAEGSICGPIAVDDNYIFVKVVSTDENSTMGSIIESMYDYYAYQLPVSDVANAIFASDKFNDNFTSQFLSMLLGNVTSTTN